MKDVVLAASATVLSGDLCPVMLPMGDSKGVGPCTSAGSGDGVERPTGVQISVLLSKLELGAASATVAGGQGAVGAPVASAGRTGGPVPSTAPPIRISGPVCSLYYDPSEIWAELVNASPDLLTGPDSLSWPTNCEKGKKVVGDVWSPWVESSSAQPLVQIDPADEVAILPTGLLVSPPDSPPGPLEDLIVLETQEVLEDEGDEEVSDQVQGNEDEFELPEEVEEEEAEQQIDQIVLPDEEEVVIAALENEFTLQPPLALMELPPPMPQQQAAEKPRRSSRLSKKATNDMDSVTRAQVVLVKKLEALEDSQAITGDANQRLINLFRGPLPPRAIAAVTELFAEGSGGGKGPMGSQTAA